jgi:NAD(P)-dependent dehydrogenase (short-subunit alcohol dehydrogenase family)
VFDLHRKVAIVTGGASGIGKSTAELFADVGASVLVADVNDRDGAKVVDGIRAAGGIATFRHTDVSVVKELRAMIDRAFEVYGKLDILFNNAGIVYFKGSLSTSEEEFMRTIDVNLKSVFFGSKFAAGKMRTGGSIINVSSVNAVIGSANVVAYSASKGGVLALTVALAKEFAPRGIRVNCIIPGPIDTPINDTRPEMTKNRRETLASFANATLLKRVGRPIDVAYGALYLASDASAYVTGSALTIDGGRLAGR